MTYDNHTTKRPLKAGRMHLTDVRLQYLHPFKTTLKSTAKLSRETASKYLQHGRTRKSDRISLVQGEKLNEKWQNINK
jgi:hypothetical protein